MPAPIIRAIRVNSDRTLVDLPDFTADLASMQAVVGGYIEGVTCNLPGLRMYVNEEGKLHGLPINRVASMFYPGPDWIVGDVLFVGDSDSEWDASVPEEAAAAIKAMVAEIALIDL